jgi:hypothetical protein
MLTGRVKKKRRDRDIVVDRGKRLYLYAFAILKLVIARSLSWYPKGCHETQSPIQEDHRVNSAVPPE